MKLLLLASFRDTRLHWRRSLSVAAVVAVALAGSLGLRGAEAVVEREMARSFAATRPASVVIQTPDVDSVLVDAVASLDGVLAVEARATRIAQIEAADGSLVPFVVFVTADPGRTAVNRFTTINSGSDALPDLWIESGSLGVLGAESGDIVTMVFGNMNVDVRIGESIDEGIPPGDQGLRVWGHASTEMAGRVGLGGDLDEVRIAVDADIDPTVVQQNAVDLIEGTGQEVTYSAAAKIPRHPQHAQMGSVLDTTRTFALLTAVVAVVLIGQIAASVAYATRRQLALASLVGARTVHALARQIATFAVPVVGGTLVGAVGGLTLTAGLAPVLLDVLSIRPASALPPLQETLTVVALVPVGVGLLVALFSLATIRTPLTQALTSAPRTTVIPRWLGSGLKTYPIRSLARRPTRTISVIVALGLAGAMILATASIRAGWISAAAEETERIDYDIVVRTLPTNPDLLTAQIRKQPGVAIVEAWAQLPIGEAPNAAAATGDVGILIGVPSGSDLISAPENIDGRWFKPEAPNETVLDARLAELLGADIGSRVILPVLGFDLEYEVVGITPPELGTSRKALVDRTQLATTLDFADIASLLYITSDASTPASLQATSAAVDDRLRQANLPVLTIQTIDQERQRIANHIAPLVAILLILGILAATIASVGLATTTELNTLERRREIGVIRMLGATQDRVASLLAAEAIAAACIAGALALPLSTLIASAIAGPVGEALLGRPVPVSANHGTAAIWLITSSAIAAAAAVQSTRSFLDQPLNMEMTK